MYLSEDHIQAGFSSILETGTSCQGQSGVAAFVPFSISYQLIGFSASDFDAVITSRAHVAVNFKVILGENNLYGQSDHYCLFELCMNLAASILIGPGRPFYQESFFHFAGISHTFQTFSP